jgi:phage terminase small subunit
MKANMRVVQDGEVVEVNKNLYVILTSLPAPDKKFNLTDDQKYWYKFFGKQLVESKKLTKPDLVHLHRLAKSVDYYIQAENHIDKLGYYDGLVQVFKTGATNVSAHVTLRDKMLADIDSLSSHFGFSFKDRSKLKEQTTNPGQLDIWAEYSKQKGVM